MKVKKLGWYGLDRICKKLARKIERPDVILAISRGGCYVGLRLSHLLDDVPMAVVSCKRYTNSGGVSELKSNWLVAASKKINDKDNILLVDEINREGGTLQRTLEEMTIRFPYNKKQTAVLHYVPESNFKPDYYVKKINPNVWIRYPYEKTERDGLLRRFLKRYLLKSFI